MDTFKKHNGFPRMYQENIRFDWIVFSNRIVYGQRPKNEYRKANELAKRARRTKLRFIYCQRCAGTRS